MDRHLEISLGEMMITCMWYSRLCGDDIKCDDSEESQDLQLVKGKLPERLVSPAVMG